MIECMASDYSSKPNWLIDHLRNHIIKKLISNDI